MEKRYVDPGILEIIGVVAAILSVVEQIQRTSTVSRFITKRQHRAISRLRRKAVEHIDDARSGIRVISSVLDQQKMEPSVPSFGVNIPSTEIEVYKRGVNDLLSALKKLWNTALDLESRSASRPQDAEIFFNLSELSEKARSKLQSAIEGNPSEIEPLLDELEQYLIECSQILSRE